MKTPQVESPMDDNDFPHDPSEPSEATQIVDSAALRKVREEIANRDQAYLIVIAGPHTGKMFKLERTETVVGRSPGSELQLQDVGISRSHARLYRVGADFFLEDLQSANGTFVNGQRVITSQQLIDGDKIAIGSSTVVKFTFTDKVEEAYQKNMVDAALRDGLTNAYNKKYFLNHILSEFAYAKRHNTHLALLMFDVDHFKSINDNFGHQAGDYVLSNLSRIAHQTLRAEDTFCRYGGEEFAVVCRSITMYQAFQLAERMRKTVENTTFEYDNKLIPVRISIGVASFPEIEVETQDELIGAADAALYQAKRSGRNRVEMAR